MKKSKLIDILEEQFPKMSSLMEDFIGEQVKIKDDINKIMVTLDITLDVINQAAAHNVDLIISHHPFFFGEKNELLKRDKLLKTKYDFLTKEKIGCFVIHTNADFNPNSIAYMQALAMNLENIEQNVNNLSVCGKFKKELNVKELSNLIKDSLELKEVEFRSNFDNSFPIEKILIASGSSGSEINFNNDDVVNIIGEMKHHEWVKANEKGIKVIEISHFSEKIFKNIINIFLEKENIDVILSEEKNGYKIV